MQCESCDLIVEKEIAERRIRDENEATFRRLRLSNLPADYRDGSRTLGHLPMRVADALTACQMLGGGVRGLYLHGPAGSFKTSVAACYLASQIRGGASGRYVPVHDLFEDIHASYRNDDSTSRAILVERCVTAPLLVLDDLGKEKASEHAAGVIFQILDGRYRNYVAGSWLIVTSNFDLDALCDRFPSEEFADPIRRRLSELTVSVGMGPR